MVFRRSFEILLALMLSGVPLAGCAPRTHELLHAVLWVQTAAEFEVLSESTFDRAAEYIQEASSFSESAGLPPAVVLDIDETVLSNAPYEAELVRTGSAFEPETWNEWLGLEAAEALPGSRGFIARARELGVEVVYITNRNQSSFDATLRNLQRSIDEAASEELLLMRDGRPDWGGDKQSRRDYVESRFNVIAYLGDDLNDFVSVYTLGSEDRARVAREHRDRFSEDWFLLPNPMYGSWERAVRKDAPGNDRESLRRFKASKVRGYK